MHVFAEGRKNMNDIFWKYVCSASHMHPGLHFQSVASASTEGATYIRGLMAQDK